LAGAAAPILYLEDKANCQQGQCGQYVLEFLATDKINIGVLGSFNDKLPVGTGSGLDDDSS
jgi:hypothetical protein